MGLFAIGTRKNPLKVLKRSEAIYVDVLVKFEITWGTNNLFYHRLSFRILWNNRSFIVGTGACKRVRSKLLRLVSQTRKTIREFARFGGN